MNFGGLELPEGAGRFLNLSTLSQGAHHSIPPSELELQQSLRCPSLVLFRPPYSLSLLEYATSDSGKSVGYIKDRKFSERMFQLSIKYFYGNEKNKQTN